MSIHFEITYLSFSRGRGEVTNSWAVTDSHNFFLSKSDQTIGLVVEGDHDQEGLNIPSLFNSQYDQLRH